MAAKGILRRLRGDGSLIRALFIALALQILSPAFGILPARAAPTADQGITVCTAHGIVTLIPDGAGGWTEKAAPKQAGIACAFCLPLLSGAVAPAADVIQLLPPEVAATPVDARIVFTPPAALPPGSASPRAPPVLR
jgi:hypothetical protein